MDLTDGKSTLGQVMAWCHQATNHYLTQCWPRYLLPYGVTRPQWVNFSGQIFMWIPLMGMSQSFLNLRLSQNFHYGYPPKRWKSIPFQILVNALLCNLILDFAINFPSLDWIQKNCYATWCPCLYCQSCPWLYKSLTHWGLVTPYGGRDLG